MFFSLNISKRILIMANNAKRLAHDEDLNPVMGGKDELAALDRSFHETANALAESRKKERAVFDNSKDVLCILSANGGFLSANSAAENLWGYSKKELLEVKLENLILQDDLDACRTALLGPIDPAKGVKHECRMLRRDGSIAHVLWVASRQAEQTSTFCVVHDIEDRIALEQLRQDFLAMVSHDLRTPLTAINGVTQIMAAGAFGKITEESAVCLSGVKRNVESLLELIGDILDLEKLDAGRMELIKDPVRLGDILDDVEKQLSNVQCSLKKTIDSADRELTVEADKDRFTQSITNLAKFLFFRSRGEVSMKLAGSKRGVEIWLSDNGPQLSELDCKQLFWRLKEPSESRSLGADATFHADLVLPLAAKTIESHGGTVSVEMSGNGCNLIHVFIPARLAVAQGSTLK
jgi:PAS domain S-box-containing protein